MSETYNLLTKRREDIRAWIAKAQADLNDVETALAAIAPQQPPQPAEPAASPPHITIEDPLNLNGQQAVTP